MKPQFLTFFLAFTAITTSCSKNDNNSAQDQEASLTFTLNGTTQYKISSDLDLKNDKDSGAIFVIDSSIIQGKPVTYFYRLEARHYSLNQFWFYTSPISKLSQAIYATTKSSVTQNGGFYSAAKVDQNAFALSQADNQVTITITSIHDGLADGTISAKLNNTSPTSQFSSITITEGKFKNILILDK